MTTSVLPNFFASRWQTGTGSGMSLFDPVLGTELARVSNSGMDLAESFAFARKQGGSALRAVSYSQRAALRSPITEVLQSESDAYDEIATANCSSVATLMPNDSIEEAYAMIRRGEGSLLCSVYSEDPAFTAQALVELASGHGNVLPMSLHGGPCRAGGGEELGGLRAPNFDHRRTAFQGSAQALDQRVMQGAATPL